MKIKCKYLPTKFHWYTAARKDWFKAVDLYYKNSSKSLDLLYVAVERHRKSWYVTIIFRMKTGLPSYKKQFQTRATALEAAELNILRAIL